MAKHVWTKFLTEEDRVILEKSHMASRVGFGARPAILVIDATWAFTGDRNEPIVESMKRWSMSCGERAWNALPAMKKLIETGRGKGIPVIYTVYPPPRSDGWDMGSWRWKVAKEIDATVLGERSPDIDALAVHDEIRPGPRDLVVAKLKPSGFHGTPLNSFLNLLGADSLLVVGGVTSGCVRATVLDAFNENYRIALIEEGLFDRFESSHAMSLFDMDTKYADVVGIEETVEYLNSLPDRLFELPAGS